MVVNIGAWLRAANPFRAPRDMAEAQRASRMGAAALIIYAVHPTIYAIRLALEPGQVARAMAAYMPAGELDVQDIEMGLIWVSSLTPWIVGASLLIVALLLVLARIQWRRMTRAIPIILLAFVAYRLVSWAAPLADIALGKGQMGLMGAVDVVSFVLSVPLILSACRGAILLHHWKRSAS